MTDIRKRKPTFVQLRARKRKKKNRMLHPPQSDVRTEIQKPTKKAHHLAKIIAKECIHKASSLDILSIINNAKDCILSDFIEKHGGVMRKFLQSYIDNKEDIQWIQDACPSKFQQVISAEDCKRNEVITGNARILTLANFCMEHTLPVALHSYKFIFDIHFRAYKCRKEHRLFVFIKDITSNNHVHVNCMLSNTNYCLRPNLLRHWTTVETTRALLCKEDDTDIDIGIFTDNLLCVKNKYLTLTNICPLPTIIIQIIVLYSMSE